MTPTRYHLERFAGLFGYSRKVQRLGDAASETQLLHEAEAYLGERIWEKTEAIEALASEYWSLRKQSLEHEQLTARIEEHQQRLAQAELERDKLLDDQGSAEYQALDQRRNALVSQLQTKAARREEISAEGQAVRKQHHAEKTKLEVLGRDAKTKPAELTKVRERLEALALRFDQLKAERDRISAEISQGDTQVDELDRQLRAISEKNHELASGSLEIINRINKQVWQLRAEIGLLEAKMHQHHAQIGRHVSRNLEADPACRAAAKSHRGLIDVMSALRRSIAFNHRLAGLY